MESKDWNVGLPISYSLSDLKNSNYKGIICLETASALNGLSTFDPRFYFFFTKSVCYIENPITINSILGRVVVNEIDDTDIIDLGDGLFVTDKERTICDMIEYNRHEFHLYETLISAYVDNLVDIDKLEIRAKSRGIYNKLQELRILAIEDLKEEC